MARPTKQGIDYFPLDCQFDDKIEMYLIEKEANGLAVLISIWQIIYSNEGYYTHNGNDLLLLVKKRINVSINEVNECINLCLKRGIFDPVMYKKHGILTSRAIQKRFFEAAKRKKLVEYDERYIINGVNVCNNSINVVHLSPNVNVKGKGEVKEDVNVNIREQEFAKSLEPYKEKYERKLLVKFFLYWSETNQKNKMRFEEQKFFALSKRLATFKLNEEKWNKKYGKRKDELTQDQRDKLSKLRSSLFEPQTQ